MRPGLVLALCACLCSSTAWAGGWRGDGHGRAAGPDVADWNQIGWQTELGGTAYATPVADHGQIYVLIEPTTLVALDAATGAERWRADHPVLHALPEALAADLRPQLATVGERTAAVEAARTRQAQLLRDARRAGQVVTPQQLHDAAEAVATAEASLNALKPFLPADGHAIGHAATTPITQAQGVTVLFGNGVLAQHAPDGTLRWQRWLGPSVPGKEGFHDGDGASLQQHAGRLLVPWGHLMAVDPTTGDTLWVGPKYLHYGTPTPAWAGDVPVVITPLGQLVDGRDGQVLQTNLPHVTFVNAEAHRDKLWWAGGFGDRQSNAPNLAAHWTLSLKAGQPVATEVWSSVLDSRDRIYSAPLVHNGRMHSITRGGELHVWDAADGELLHKHIVPDLVGPVRASLLWLDNGLYVPSVNGTSALIQATPPFAVVHTHTLAHTHANPVFVGGSVYVRGDTDLRCIGPCDGLP